MRAFAVLFVILFHTQANVFPGGFVGVDIFFVLSGFLITGILVREHDRTGSVRLGNFYIRRALRLLPALLFLALVLVIAYSVLLDPAKRGDSIVAVLAAVGYATSPLAAAGVEMGSMLHAWSLSVEEYFYVVWPLALVLIVPWVGRSRATPVVLAITAIAVAYRLGAALSGWPIERIYYAADTRAEQLLIGCSLALVLLARPLRPPWWLVAACAAVVVAFVIVPEAATASLYRYGGSTLVALAAAVVIASLVVSNRSRLSRALSAPPLVWVGKRSYAIYLWHAPLAAMIAFALPAWIPLLPVDLALTLVAAALSYRFIEQPFLKLKVRFGAGKERNAAAPRNAVTPARPSATPDRASRASDAD